MPSRVPHTHIQALSFFLFLLVSSHCCCCCCLLDWMLWILFSLLVFVRRILHPLPLSFFLPILHHPLSVCCTEDVCVCAYYTRARNGTKVAPMAVAAVFMSYAAHLRWHRAAFSRLKGASNPLSLSLFLFQCLSSKIDVNPFDNINFVLLLLQPHVHYR